MLEDALRYPASGDDALTTVVIGGILGVLGFLIIPAFFVYGYLVRVVRDVSDGVDETPPTFTDWEELLIDGIKAFVVVLVYTVVPAIVLAFTVAPFVLIASVSTDGGGGGGSVFGMFLALLGFTIAGLAVIALVAAVYVVPAAIGAFARTDRLGAAFSISHLRAITGSSQYVTAWLVAAVIVVLFGVFAGIAAATIVGILLLPFVNFYGNVAAAYAIGSGVAEDRTATAARETSTVETDRLQ